MFKLGQQVKVRANLPVETLRRNPSIGVSFSSYMDRTLGKVGVIVEVTYKGNYMVDFKDRFLNRNESDNPYWIYHSSWLTHPNEVLIVEED